MAADSQFPSTPRSAPSSTAEVDSLPGEGRLLGLLCASIYVLFTLLPDSHSLMVAWPWVFIWQVGVSAPILWLLWQLWQSPQFRGLGNGLDAIAALVALGLILSASVAEFPNQARWFAWAALGFLAALYALNTWCQTARRRYHLLVAQGGLSLGFIVISLGLWTSQTLLPELGRLQTLRQAGLDVSFSFSVLELRNWAPIGHQNYVAGYLLLALPLLVGLSIIQSGKWRWVWLSGIGLGLLDLYTTSSRGGWLGLMTCGLLGGVILFRTGSIPRLWKIVGGVGGLGLLLVLIGANNRLQAKLAALLDGNAGGELAFRHITTAAGWAMGRERPWAGLGPGSVPMLYQQYRPDWAGLEAENVYQLHGTLPQLWAELGIWGLVPLLLLVLWLVYQGWRWLRADRTNPTPAEQTESILVCSLYGGLLAYGVMGLTDYQLDNVCISGSLVIFLAVLAATFRQRFCHRSETLHNGPGQGPTKVRRLVAGLGVGLFLAVGIWLIPIHGAWNFSSQGFMALANKQLEPFEQKLTQAQSLAPWEPYYPYQLGWNLGDRALASNQPQQQEALLKQGIAALQQGNQVSPYREFGHSNLGWLLLQQDPEAAAQAFAQSARLVPAKRGVFFGLGLSLLVQGKSDLAADAMALECLRNPLWITSPIWQTQPFQSLYPAVLERMTAQYDQLLRTHSESSAFNTFLHQSRGGLNWWRGDFKAAQADLEQYGTPLSKTLLEVATTNQFSQDAMPHLPKAAKLLIQAWFEPQQRQQLLAQAWLIASQTPASPESLQRFLDGMEQASTFQQWLQQFPPIQKYRRTRSGFNVISRHIDGPAPTDFFVVVDNLAMTTFLEASLPTPKYMPELDRGLQPWRQKLLNQVG